MTRIRNIFTGVALAAALSFGAFAANLTPVTGPQDPSQLNATLNTVINQANTQIGAPALANGLPAATTGTAIQTLATLTVPGNVLSKVGQGVRVTCLGTGTATGTNTLTVQWGSATAFADAGAATTAGVFKAVVHVFKTGASTQQVFSEGSFNATAATPTVVSGTETDTAPISTLCRGTSTTTGNFTLVGAFIENLQ